MSIRDEIARALQARKLIPAQRIASWSGEPRMFLMCKPLFNEVENGKINQDQKVRQRWATLEAAMSYFIEGGLVTDDLMKQLKPDKYEHWELRSRRPKPSLRVFGRFAMPNVFIGTHVKLRDGLGGMWSPEFEKEKLICEDHWKEAGLIDPFSSPPQYQYEDYITSNAHKKIRIKP